jgi:hypothetical protein
MAAKDRFAHDFGRVAAGTGERVVIQPDTRVNAPEDAFEREAERIADRIMLMSGSRRNSPAESGDFPAEQPFTMLGPETLRPETGKPLPDGMLAFMKPYFGDDLSRVQVHTDDRADFLSRVYDARAFTLGDSIFFRRGAYKPDEPGGLRLLAHELTHVVQQRYSGVSAIQRSPDAPSFVAAKWLAIFKTDTNAALNRFGLGPSEVPVKEDKGAAGSGKKIHPAHYDPNKRVIHFKTAEFKRAFAGRVLGKKKTWSVADYERFVRETALHEAFHAYQDTPRHKSGKFKALVAKTVADRVVWSIEKMIASGTIKDYDQFKKTVVPALTRRYGFTAKIKAFAAELPARTADRKWRLSAEEEIRNQWLHVLDDYYWRAKEIVSARAKGHKRLKEAGITPHGGFIKEPKPEDRERVSLVELQAEKFATIHGRLRVHGIELKSLLDRLKREKTPAKRRELTKKINKLKKETDIKRIPELVKKSNALKAEIKADLDKALKLKGGAAKDVRDAAIAKIKRLQKLEKELDILYTLRDGIAAALRRDKLIL